MNRKRWIILGSGIVAIAIFASLYLAGKPSSVDHSENKAIRHPPSKPGQSLSSSQTGYLGTKQPLTPAQEAAVIDQGEFISNLFEAAAEGTPAKIESIYTALTHPDAKVREAAIDVIVQSIGRDGIPRLRAALSTAPTTQDRKNLEEAIEFLELPTLSESQPSPEAAKSDRRLPTRKGSLPTPSKP